MGVWDNKQEAIEQWNSRVAPQWSSDPPTEPGWYWSRGYNVDPSRSFMTEVYWYEGRLVYLTVASRSSGTFSGGVARLAADFQSDPFLQKIKWLKIAEPELPPKE